MDTPASSTRRALSFEQRRETFGFDTDEPWALPALRLICSVPRAYEPLVDAWDQVFPGTRKALGRLVRMDFVAYQAPIIINTRTGEKAGSVSMALRRYRLSPNGKRLLRETEEDPRVLLDRFPKLTASNTDLVIAMLREFNLERSEAKIGLSAPYVIERSGLPERTGRWWVQHLVKSGHLKELGEKHADTRDIIPAHWRITPQLCKQVAAAVTGFDQPASLHIELRLGRRSGFNTDIDPARRGPAGATDFDHDVQTQRILAALLRSSNWESRGAFSVEPRITLPVNTKAQPWQFQLNGKGYVHYQPDAELRERVNGQVHRSILEYERYQTRRDAWSHIERFLGWLSLRALPGEPAILRFVVDSNSKVRSYLDLIEAFADYASEHPEHMPPNPVTLAVTSSQRVLNEQDPLSRGWHRITLPTHEGTDTESSTPVLHREDAGPYDDYFSRGVY